MPVIIQAFHSNDHNETPPAPYVPAKNHKFKKTLNSLTRFTHRYSGSTSVLCVAAHMLLCFSSFPLFAICMKF